jgi:chemotaxis protein MotB
MKMTHIRPLFVLVLIALTAVACVPKKKFEAEANAKRAAEEKSKRLDRDLAAANTKIGELEGRIASLDKEYQALALKAKGCEEETAKLRSDNSDLKKRNASLAEELEKLKHSSLSEREKLDAALKKKSDELDAREKSIAELLDKLEAREKAVQELQGQLEAREKAVQALQAQLDARAEADGALRKELEARELALKELQEKIAARDKAMDDLRNKLLSALQGYQDQDLTVEVRNGKVYIAISDKMLFKSGSAKVEQLGKDALAKVATVLLKYPDMDLIIEGHTDNLPIKTEKFSDNWDLSVIRATSVVRILTVEYGLPAARVTPSGKGEHFPKASNDTPEGRSQNRRTEIIIAPKLDALEEMIKVK